MQDTGCVDQKTGASIQKRECVIRCNELTGGVDRRDQLVKYYTFAHKVMKVWKKQFFYMMNLMVLQGYIIYMKYSSDKPKKSQYKFRHAAVCELITTSHSIESLPHFSQCRSSSNVQPLMRLTARVSE